MEEQEHEQDDDQELIPIEQEKIRFEEEKIKEIFAVRLPDGQVGVVLRPFCENLQIETNGQVRRIRRTKAIADDLVYMRVDTGGGLQRMAVLLLHGFPYWLLGIETSRICKFWNCVSEIL